MHSTVGEKEFHSFSLTFSNFLNNFFFLYDWISLRVMSALRLKLTFFLFNRDKGSSVNFDCGRKKNFILFSIRVKSTFRPGLTTFFYLFFFVLFLFFYHPVIYDNLFHFLMVYHPAFCRWPVGTAWTKWGQRRVLCSTNNDSYKISKRLGDSPRKILSGLNKPWKSIMTARLKTPLSN